jgi:putative Holliday junction resolvase
VDTANSPIGSFPQGRILSLDVGKKRIGLAISDLLGITAQGLETLHRTTIREDLTRLQAIIDDYGVTRLLVGDPRRLTGEVSRQGEHIREFASLLTRVTGLPVVYWDERFTSVAAERLLRETGHHTRLQRKGQVDRVAASLLLESYLSGNSPQEEGDSPHA